jgi:hypothetical protein
MNAIETHDTQGSRHDSAGRAERQEATPQMDMRHVHHAREFGIGYGNSSGYGSSLHFTDGHEDALFKFR